MLYTHAHADHIAGLDEIRILNRIIGRAMPVYATGGIWEELRQRFDYAFKPFKGGFFSRPVLELEEIAPGRTVPIMGMAVTLIDQDHGFSRSLGLRVGNFAYCTDVVRLDETALATLTGSMCSWWIASPARKAIRRMPVSARSWPGWSSSGRSGQS